MCGGDITYDLKAFSGQACHSSSDCLGDPCVVSTFVFLHYVQELVEKQVDPKPLHSRRFRFKRAKHVQDSVFDLLV